MIKGVIFDFDGIIVDSEYISFQSYRDFLRNYHIELTKEDYVTYCPGKQLITSMMFFKEYYHLDIDIEDACRYFRKREEYYANKDGIPLKKGIEDLLKYLQSQQIKICLATSSLKKRASKILSDHHLIDYFDEFVFGDEVKRGKPFPDVFLKACDKIHVNPQKAIVIEDSEAGIEAAFQAHIPVICIPDMKYPDENHCHMASIVYPDLTYIKEYIEMR